MSEKIVVGALLGSAISKFVRLMLNSVYVTMACEKVGQRLNPIDYRCNWTNSNKNLNFIEELIEKHFHTTLSSVRRGLSKDSDVDKEKRKILLCPNAQSEENVYASKRWSTLSELNFSIDKLVIHSTEKVTECTFNVSWELFVHF